MSPVLALCLPKAGVCRTFPQRCIYAPLSLQGLGVPHPFATQVQSHLDMLLRHPANRTQTAKYLEAVVQAHQLETGTSYGLLQQDYSNTAILASDTWLKRVWQELESIDAYVAFDSPALDLQREGDGLLMEAIQELVALPLLRERWRDKGTISAAAEQEIDWSTVRRSMHAMPAFLQRWLTKHSTGICGVGKFLKLWKTEPQNTCPLCGEEEDHLHVPRCKDSRATNKWNQHFKALESWMDLHNAGAAIKQGILHVLRSVRFPDQLDYQSLSPRMRAAVASQLIIGPQGLLEGRLSALWRPLQHQYYKSIGSRRSAHLWASRLAQQLNLIGHKMWSHRNTIKHSDDSFQARIDHRRLNAGILSEFAMGQDDLPADVKPMLAGASTAQDLLRSNLQRKKDWLSLVSQAPGTVAGPWLLAST